MYGQRFPPNGGFNSHGPQRMGGPRPSRFGGPPQGHWHPGFHPNSPVFHGARQNNPISPIDTRDPRAFTPDRDSARMPMFPCSSPPPPSHPRYYAHRGPPPLSGPPFGGNGPQFGHLGPPPRLPPGPPELGYGGPSIRGPGCVRGGPRHHGPPRDGHHSPGQGNSPRPYQVHGRGGGRGGIKRHSDGFTVSLWFITLLLAYYSHWVKPH